MKTVALEEISPAVVEGILACGEEVSISRAGQTIARLIPSSPATAELSAKYTPPDFIQRLIEQWGPDAFANAPSVQELFDELREHRRFL